MTASSPSRFVPIAATGIALALSWVVLATTLRSPPPHPSAQTVSGLAARRAFRALPVEAQTVISSTLGASQAAFRARRTRTGYRLQSGSLEIELDRGGARMSAGERTLSMALSAIGRGRRLLPVAAGSVHARANRVLSAHAGVKESYAAGPLGIEQEFEVVRRATGRGPLTLALSLQGSLHGVLSGSQVEFAGSPGQPRLRYSDLSASDATGRRLPAWLELSRGLLLIRVADAGARYPLRIDPLIEQGEALAPNDESSNGQFGFGVALSADGDTALVGARGDSGQVGAAWIFTRSGSTWTQQGAKLTGTGEIGEGEFGASVALSADGDTALVGAPADNDNSGGAWIFTRSGSSWTQHCGKLTGSEEVGEGQFGASVALSADSLTALVGAPYDYGSAGAAWIFTRSGSTWTPQGKRLAANDESGLEESLLGWSVALSADGNTALIGGWGENNFTGAAWVFVRSGSNWTQQGPKLTGSAGKRSWFGYRVALSADGDTALIGGPGNISPTDVGGSSEEGDVGAAWIFTRSGSTWTQQGEKLSPPRENLTPEFGSGVALSASGDTALIGGPTDGEGSAAGSAWIFTRSGSTWTQQGAKIKGISNLDTASLFGFNVALSADATTALIGGPFTNAVAGAAWVFVANPQISIPTSLSFASQTVGRPSPVLWLEVKNTGAAPLAGLTFHGPAQITGRDASEFSIPNGDDLCQSETLQPSQTCLIGVQFNAATTGPSSATLNLGANNSPSTPTVTLTGTGTQTPNASFTSSENAAVTGKPISFNAATSSAPDGAIERYAWNFGDGTTTEGIAPRHTYATSGSYTVTLTVTDNDGLTSQTTHPLIVKAAQTIELLSSAPASAEAGGPSYEVVAIASSGLPVGLTSATPSVCRVEGATVSFIEPGDCTIEATQPGNAEYEAAPEAQQSVTVDKGRQLIRFTSSLPNTATVGSPHATLSASASSGLSVTLASETPGVCTLEGPSVSFIAAGTCTIDANQPGNLDYDAAPQAQQSTIVRSQITSPTQPARSNSSFSLVRRPTGNRKTGAITFTATVVQPGRITWLITLPSEVHSRECQVAHDKTKRRCRSQQALYAKGSLAINTPGVDSITTRPTQLAKTALADAVKHRRRLHITARINYAAAGGGNLNSYTQTITI
jgi:PKD repeat protein